MRRHAAEALGATIAAAAITIVIAAPVLRAPSERIFGAEIVGRHHDPFTVMQQFAGPSSLGVYLQPVTDLSGAAIARVTGAVSAYNWLVLLSFPLAAAAAYLLARHLALPPAAALLAALLFAFSPFHVAHAAYHPHVAQVQWIPLYLLALWRCMDEATVAAVAFLAIAIAAVTLSNFYGGLIAAVITPIAVAAYWFGGAGAAPGGRRALALTTGTLACMAVAGAALIWWTAPGVLSDARYAASREDLFRFSAKWWSYLVPPVAHPLLGGVARQIWIGSRVEEGLLEQQVSLGWGVIALGLIAVSGWPSRRATTRVAPMLASIAVVALICSLSPERMLFGWTIARPSALLYAVVPMFRSYARFGVVVQLMAALLAAIGASRLLAARTRSTRALCAGLVLVAMAEYAVWPAALWRDVLPTAAHRWVMRQTAGSHVYDCAPLTAASVSVPWLTDGRIALADAESGDCAEPELAGRLWAAGFTHVLVRDTWERPWLRDHGAGEGIALAAHFADADVFSLRPDGPVYTQTIAGFWPREHAGNATWRWMGTDASWVVVTPTPRPRVTLEIEMQAFHVARPLAVRLDGGSEQQLEIDENGRTYRIGPLALSPGAHLLTFHSAAPATIADGAIGNGDRRALSISVGAWKWSAE